MAGFQKAFQAIDTDNDGFITIEELKEYMGRMHYKESFVTKWISLFDPEGSGQITYKQYCETLGLRYSDTPPSSPVVQSPSTGKSTGEVASSTAQAKPSVEEQEISPSKDIKKQANQSPTTSSSDAVTPIAEPVVQPVLVASQSAEPSGQPNQAGKGKRQRNAKSGSQKNSMSEKQSPDTGVGAVAMDVIEPTQAESMQAEPVCEQKPHKKQGRSRNQSKTEDAANVDSPEQVIASERAVPANQQKQKQQPQKQGKRTPRSSTSVAEGETVTAVEATPVGEHPVEMKAQKGPESPRSSDEAMQGVEPSAVSAGKGKRQRNAKSAGSQKNSISEKHSPDFGPGPNAMDVIEPTQAELMQAEPIPVPQGEKPHKKQGRSPKKSSPEQQVITGEQEAPMNQQKPKQPRKQGKRTPRSSTSVEEQQGATIVGEEPVETKAQKEPNQPKSPGSVGKPARPVKRAHFLSESAVPESSVRASQQQRPFKRTYVTYDRKRNSQSESKAFPPPGRLFSADSGTQSPHLAGGPGKIQKPFSKQHRPMRIRSSNSETDRPADAVDIKQWVKSGKGGWPKKNHGPNKRDAYQPPQAEKSADGSPSKSGDKMDGNSVAPARPERQPIEEEVFAVTLKPGLQAVPPSALTKDLASDEEMEMEDPLQMPVEDTIQPVTQKPDLQAQAPSALTKDLASDEEMEMEDPLQMPTEDTIQPVTQKPDLQAQTPSALTKDLASDEEIEMEDPLQMPVEDTIQPVTQKPDLQAQTPSAPIRDLASDEEIEMEDPLQMPVENTIQPVTQKPDLQAQTPSALTKDLASDEEMEMEDPLQMPVEDTVQPIVSTETTQLASVPPLTEEKREVVESPDLAEVKSNPAPEATEPVGGKKAKKGSRDRKGTSSSSGESAEQQQQQPLHPASESAEPADGKKAKKASRNRKDNSSSSGESVPVGTPVDEPVKQSPTLAEEPNSVVPPKGQQQKNGNKRTSESSDTKADGKQPEKVTPSASLEDVIQPVAAAETLQSAPVSGAPVPDLASDEEMEMADPLAEGFTPVYKSPEEGEQKQPLCQASESAEPADDKKTKKPGKNRKSTSSSSGDHAPAVTLVEEPNSSSQPKAPRQKKGNKRTSESSVTHDEVKQQEERERAADPSNEAKPVEDVFQPVTAAAETLQSAPIPGATMPDLASDEEMEMADPLAEDFTPAEESLPPVQSTVNPPPNLEQPVVEARTEPQDQIPKAAEKDKKGTHRQKSKSGSEREPKKERRSPKGAAAGTDEPNSEGSQSSGEQGTGKKKPPRKEEKLRVEKQSSDSKVKPKLEAGGKEPEAAVEPLISEQVTAAVPVPTSKAEEQFSTSKPTTSLSEIAAKLEEVVEIATQKEQKPAAAAKQKPAGKAAQQQQQPEKVPSEAPVDGQVQSAAVKAATKAPKKTPKQQQPKKKAASSQQKPMQDSDAPTPKNEQQSGKKKRKHEEGQTEESSKQMSSQKKKRAERQAKRAAKKPRQGDEAGEDGSSVVKAPKRPRRGHIETGKFPRSFAVQVPRRRSQHRRDGAQVATDQVGKRVKGEKTKLSRAHRQADKPSKNVRRWKLRASLRKPGTVVIILAGRHRGKRAVCVGRHAHSGLLLITGPYSVNGIPVRRIHPDYVLATKTVLRLHNFHIPKRLHSKTYFARSKPSRKELLKKAAENIFVDKTAEATAYKVSEQRKKDQVAVDKQVLQAIRQSSSHKLLMGYLKSMFSLSAHDYPHKMVF